jgi:plastocyanin
VVGVQPLGYQWLMDNLPLTGATNASLILSNVLGKDAGAYRVIASNALGSVASQPANVTVSFNTNLAAVLNTTNWNWLTPADRNIPWFAQNRETHDGDAAAQSGAIVHNQQSTLQTTITGPGTLTFWWKVSSEEGFDFLRVFVDQGSTPLMSISGETGWEQRSISITNGTHVLRWVYSKDGSVSAGHDAGWLDEVAFTPPPPTVNIQPDHLTVSAGSNVSFFAVTSSTVKPVTFQWMRFGTNIAGATNQTLSLPFVGRKDRGTYAVRAANAGGSTLSRNATLAVRVAQRLQAPVRFADGSWLVTSGDADGGALRAEDLAALEVLASTNLVNWVTVPGVPALTNGSLVLLDLGSTNFPVRFYRMVEH